MGLFSSSKKTTSTSTPWAPQAGALQDIFSKAGALYDKQGGTPWYGGDLYASMDPAQAEAIRSMMQYASANGGADKLDAIGGSMTDPSKFNGAIDNITAMYSQDPTQANIAAATAYANNPAIDGMIDAASRDVNRNLYEGQIPGINRAATGTGNVNSSRAGVAEGIATRGAQDMIGDISAGIRGDAYNRGLSLAESARGTNMQGASTAAGLYGNQLGMGMDALTGANSMRMNNMGAAIDAGSLFQQDRQGQMDADFTRWQGNDTREADLLDRYYNIVGSNNWGGTQTQKTKGGSSILGSALGLVSTGAGLGLFGGGKK